MLEITEREQLLLRGLAEIVGVGMGNPVGWLVRGFHRVLLEIANRTMLAWAAEVDPEKEWDEGAWLEVLGVEWCERGERGEKEKRGKGEGGDGDSPTLLGEMQGSGEAGFSSP